MAKPLTLLESVLVQMLVQLMRDVVHVEEALTILQRTGLTKQQANKALGR